MDTEEKLVRLEEQAYFQEKLLTQLNEALTFQQAQIDLLEKRIAELEKLLNERTGGVKNVGNEEAVLP